MKTWNTTLTAAVVAALAAPAAVAAGSGSSASDAASSSSTGGSQPKSAEQTFSRLDTNNDGFISRPEAGIAPDVIVIFPVADLDKDDKLSRSELGEGMKKQSASQGASSGSASMGPMTNRRPGANEGDHKPQGQMGGDPLRSPPSASGGGR